MAHKQILVDMRQCHITQKDGTVAYVESRIWYLDIVGEWGPGPFKIRAMDMTWAELFEYEAKMQREKEELSHKIDSFQAGRNLGIPEHGDSEKVANWIKERGFRESMILTIHAEMHMRPALAIGCLCFAAVGCPIGVWFSKSDYLSAFITCFLPIVIVYYPLMFCMNDLGRSDKIPAWLGLYIADVVMLVIAGVLFRRLTRN
jgi:lipopolysaccharide export system permease protein